MWGAARGGRGVPHGRAICTLGRGAMEVMGGRGSSSPRVVVFWYQPCWQDGIRSFVPPWVSGPWGSLGFINVNLVNAVSSWGVSSVSPQGEQVCSAFCLDAKE